MFVVVAVERCRFRVELGFTPVGWRAGVGVVGGATEPPAGGSSYGLPKVIRPVAPGAGALAGALGDVARWPYGWHAAWKPHPECRAAHELRVKLVHLRGIVGVGLVEQADVEELDAELLILSTFLLRHANFCTKLDFLLFLCCEFSEGYNKKI